MAGRPLRPPAWLYLLAWAFMVLLSRVVWDVGQPPPAPVPLEDYGGSPWDDHGTYDCFLGVNNGPVQSGRVAQFPE